MTTWSLIFFQFLSFLCDNPLALPISVSSLFLVWGSLAVVTDSNSYIPPFRCKSVGSHYKGGSGSVICQKIYQEIQFHTIGFYFPWLVAISLTTGSYPHSLPWIGHFPVRYAYSLGKSKIFQPVFWRFLQRARPFCPKVCSFFISAISEIRLV